jgi:Bacterial regulatory helix-turn-helix protein, lysR family
MLSSPSRIRVSQAERFPTNQALGIPEKREMRQGYVGNDYLRMIDLNLFRVFNAMIELRSVVKASQALSITPSAVSHALNRLRQSIGDELFIYSESLRNATNSTRFRVGVGRSRSVPNARVSRKRK